MKAGTYAATGMGKQSPIIIAVTDKGTRDKLSAMNAKIMGQGEGFDPFYGAPELLIVLADKNVPTYIYDGSLVMGNLMNAAADLGVDSCWIHRAKEEFESEEGREILKGLGIGGNYEGIAKKRRLCLLHSVTDNDRYTIEVVESNLNGKRIRYMGHPRSQRG